MSSSESRAWVLPGEPVPVRLMNTIWADTSGIHDDLATTADVRDWLMATEVCDRITSCSRRELQRARLLRDALRRLAAFLTVDPRQAAQSPLADLDEAMNAVNALTADTQPDRLTLRHGHLTRVDATSVSPATTALAKVATEAVHLLTGPDASRLRACQAPGCVLYFVKAHPRREWCSEACGNRTRAARHYQRIRKPTA
ncbi:MAG: ABATE domain-containing protein [Mycobacteriaceae bacterium]